MIRLNIIVILILSACSSGIPDEVAIGEEPRKIVAAYCECESTQDKDVDCQKEAKNRIKIIFQDLHGADRARFLKDLMHALVESECNQQFMDDDKFNEMIKGLDEF